ncbi:sugar transferase [Nocardioides jishulii]|uniref:Sugar transferase n=1 Tax=Nocardioides jishulii TaxID=2575440 RepID=A0A4U2YRI4_9ACTN|nr:sugar transferase [Nocardioides jishulii]QCX26474.1 sugar transferase [Nocardioides jishulii]TKI63720.1 sugar transferase [Nocardioides jishulii]
MAKRAVDVFAAGLGVAVTSPLMLLAAVAVKLTSPGPVIFRQTRVGRGGDTFEILKFRTMRAGAPGAQVTAGHDPRITQVGAWLRSTKVDELPQLINVLRGDMSLVGPRPEVPRYVAEWPVEQRHQILSVRPGITDPASIEFRREAEELAGVDDPEAHYVSVILPRKVELYCDYVATQSFVGDLKILLRTLRTVAGD